MLIKGILWGWDGDASRTYGGAGYAINGVPDIGADTMITKCTGVSTTGWMIVKAINSLERRFGKLFYKLFKSITVDNGCEFQDFEGIEAAHRRKGKRTIVFFCHPYSAFERGPMRT